MRWLAIPIVLAGFALKSETLPIRTYTMADGLAADRVECIVADSRGFLWFCTPEGLSRFDGYRFINYGVDEGLANGAVATLIETRSGDYFVGTARGISRINPGGQGARFTTSAPSKEAEENNVRALRESRSGRIWCGSSRGLFEWDRTSGFRRYQVPLPNEQEITAIVEDPRGDLWVATNGGIYLLRDNRIVRTFTVKDGLPADWVNTLFLDSKGTMWVASRGGLSFFKQRPDGDWSLEKTYTNKSGLAGNEATALAESSNGILWVGTDWGITRLVLAGEPRLLKDITREQGLSDRTITALAEDQSGNMWAGTAAGGVMKIDRLGFTTYREQDGLTTDRVWSVFENRAGGLMAVTITGGSRRTVGIFDGTRFRGVVPKAFGDHATWGYHQVLLQSRTGEWWAAAKQGLCRFGAMKAEDLDGKAPKICYSEESIFRIFEDSKGGVWASSQPGPKPATTPHGDQLMRWDPEKNVVVNFPSPANPGAAEAGFGDLVSAFAEDRQGNVWLGLWHGGLYRYDAHGFQRFQQSDGVPPGTIASLLVDRAGRLWIGSNSGALGVVDNPREQRWRVEVYNKARGLSSNTIRCMVEDNQGRIYVATRRGVDRLDPKTGNIKHFSTADGLAHGVIVSAIRDRTGALWFATTQGLSRLTVAADRAPTKPRVLITDLRIGGAAYPVSQLGEARISQLEMKPSQNQIQVEFVGLDNEPGAMVRYSYKLDGADTAWSPPRSQRVVNYAALTGGHYRFLVKAVTSEGVESAASAEVDFTVLPPIWKRWWFQTLALAVAIAVVFAAHRYRVAQMVNLERMRTTIATDLHDDIGASLSQIAILSEVARVRGNGKGRPGEPLERVATLARELVDSMGDIVWSIRSEPHGMDSLIRRMREFALDLLDSQGIEFELRTPQTGEDVQLSLQARRQLFLMFKECIHNAARHSRCTRVAAELKVLDREVLLTVEDNGIGLSAVEKEPGGSGGTGIPSMRRRADSLSGRMDLTSKPGEGCRVAIHVPTRRGAFTKSSL